MLRYGLHIVEKRYKMLNFYILLIVFYLGFLMCVINHEKLQFDKYNFLFKVI